MSVYIIYCFECDRKPEFKKLTKSKDGKSMEGVCPYCDTLLMSKRFLK